MNIYIHTGENKQVIEKMFAFVSVDKNGNEGVIATTLPGMGPIITPLMGADMKMMERLYPIAKEISQISGAPFKVLEFCIRTDITDQVKEKFK